ncbi:MbnP family protein [Paraflavisolibacter sp. H34]|uniref:MbnP family protein n=1 Tax=Huijunlia imazamoxiresistens TaxID=3127457 RepID=UPI003017EB83
MSRYRNRSLPVFIAAAYMLFCGCRKKEQEPAPSGPVNVTLHFRPVSGAQGLQAGVSYTNGHNETFTVRSFKFYVSALRFVSETGGRTYAVDPVPYFLVNAFDTAALNLKVYVPAGRYNKVQFTLGVDSLRNVSGTQTGALDPANGMFWTWNTGYIMAKLEGYSPQSNQPNNLFEYHIGGFKSTENAVTAVTVSLPSGSVINTQDSRAARVDLTADVARWFSGPNDLSITTTPVCMTPGPLSVKIAQNYSGMFAVEKVE